MSTYFGGWGNCCCSSSTKVCVSACSPAVNVSGATVQILTGTTVVASCTTDSTGCCSFTQSGSYSVRVIFEGVTCTTQTKTLDGTTIAISLDPTACGSDYVCCGGYMIPNTLTLTDAAGSITLSYCATCSGTTPTWTGGHAVTKTSCTVTTPGNICTVAAPSSGPVRVCYQLTCNAGSSPVFTLQRTWSWVNESGTLTPIYYQDPAGFTPGQLCATAPPAICGSPLTDDSDGSANPSSSSPFSVTFSMTPNSGNTLTDPIGGNATVSQ